MRLDPAFVRSLERVASVREDEPLSRHTTIGIGGPADAFVTVRSNLQLASVLGLCHRAGQPVFVLGSGSNIVAGDRGIRGVVIDNQAQSLEGPFPIAGGGPRTADPSANDEAFLFRADAGCSFAGVSRQLASAGYAGLEWACGIPGTIGGAVVYNAGAYGGCLGDVLLRVGVWDPEAGETVYEARDLAMVYRGSAFTRGLMAGRAVLWAEFVLWRGDTEALKARVAEYDARRLKAQPRGRNAGSFFKNPASRPAWKLIDDVGLRGFRIGGAQFSEKHCNFLVNAGGATAANVAALKRLAEARVRETFGVDLEAEVSLVGEGFGDEA